MRKQNDKYCENQGSGPGLGFDKDMNFKKGWVGDWGSTKMVMLIISRLVIHPLPQTSMYYPQKLGRAPK